MFFMIYSWLGDLFLRDRFTGLFDLSENKLLTVANKFALGWGEGGELWK